MQKINNYVVALIIKGEDYPRKTSQRYIINIKKKYFQNKTTDEYNSQVSSAILFS